ncbi:Bug family tripartite tricarboxylate transporter substrate binding protein [Hydrogenophaga sp.]|uniref:Bug family tripartite tricarboxylate transporter substrate binding protein n=1 Tax=Hydrogenophaga sp. TaxID=1904254 RepID=UPI003F6FB311
MNKTCTEHPLSRRALLAAVPAAALSAMAPAAWAQSGFPNRALRVIVPQPPGGGFDFVGRALAERLATALGQPVVVENRTGSGTLVGTEAAAKAAPDGYTLLTGSVSNMVLNMGLYKNLPYDSLKDFEPVGLAVSYSYTLMARNSLPFNNLAELVAHAKANPGKLTYASAGNGSGQHVLAAALWNQAGVDIVHVPYRGAQAAYADLLGDRVDLFFDLTPTTRAHIETGKLKAIAVSSAARNPMQPTVQTINESGVVKLDLESWFGYFAPGKTPPEALERLRAELAKIIATPELQETFRKAGGTPMNIGVADTRTMLARDVQRWTGLIRAANISLD